MFTGIIETTAKVRAVKLEGRNLRLSLSSPIAAELKVDQSVSHNGICLTVVKTSASEYEVVAIDETLKRTNLNSIKVGDEINLERCMRVNDRLDGHIVQGHVDTTAIVRSITEQDGSWIIYFDYAKQREYVTVEKGSVCVNGVSLTVVESGDDFFSVAIIPYTMEQTNFKNLKVGNAVNIEFDIIGKYVQRLLI